MPKPASLSPPVALRARRLASAKRTLREFHESPRPVREAFPTRRQAVLFVRTHLAESAVEAVGEKDRIVAETEMAARRPNDFAIDATFEGGELPVGPGDAEGGDEGGAAVIRLPCREFLLDHA